jgi:hypothetical protein
VLAMTGSGEASDGDNEAARDQISKQKGNH